MIVQLHRIFTVARRSFSLGKSTRKGLEFGVYDPISIRSLLPLASSRAPRLSVPASIQRPEYATPSSSGTPHSPPSEIPLMLSSADLKSLRTSGVLAKKILKFAESLLKPGLTTEELDRLVHEEIIRNGAYPSPLGYHGFPKSICTSINNVLCHGIPDERPLKDGDIVNVDVTVFLDGFHGDTSATFPIGSVDAVGMELIDKTREALDKAIAVCKPGIEFKMIGDAISETADGKYGISEDFCGHGIGRLFHQPPLIQHFLNDNEGVMEKGMVFTIEPIFTQGTQEYSTAADGWTVLTKDGGRTAQFEHTLLITETGVEVLTL